jgi:cell division protein FtsB
MRRIAALLAALLLAIQWPLWPGHGGWLRVWDLQRQLAARREANAELRQRNEDLTAEIRSLREGSEAIEERARDEMRMLRPDETFFQLAASAAPAHDAGHAPGTLAPDAGGAPAALESLQFGLK